MLGFRWHKARRKAEAEVAFEAALQDSGLGLDNAFEQVGLCQQALLKLAVIESACPSSLMLICNDRLSVMI